MFKKDLYILLNNNESYKLPKKAKYLFCRSRIFAKSLNQNSYKIIIPDPKKTSRESFKLLKNEEKLSKIIINETENLLNNSEINSYEELLKPYLSLRISSYLYLDSIIPIFEKYFIYKDRKWKSFYSRTQLIVEIEEKLSLEIDSIHKGLKIFTDNNNSLVLKFLGFLQKIILKNRLKGLKELFILTDKKGYFFDDLLSSLNSKNKDIIYLYHGNNSLKYVSLLISLLISFFKRKKLINGIFLVSKNYKLNINYQIHIKDKIKNSNLVDKQYAEKLSKDINQYLSNTNSYLKYVKDIFENIKIDIRLISHSKRFAKIYALSEALEDLCHKNYLISHGSHTDQKGKFYDEIAADNLAIGLIYSNNKNTILCSQSYFADEYLRSKNKKFIKIQPLQSINLAKFTKPTEIDSLKIKILHACTIKQMGCRRYLYHSSLEYVQSLLNICKKLKPIRKDIRFLVRVRPVQNEISTYYLKEYLYEYLDFVEFSNTKSFIEELLSIDCLLALSSTTLEQAINNGIPAMSIGETGYDHFKKYKNENIPITYKNYKQLSKIEELLERKFTLISNPVRKNIYDLQEILFNN